MTQGQELGQSTTLRHSAVLGLGHHRASRVVPNSEIVDAIDSSDEWIQQRSGIVERRWATPEETVQMMSVSAARAALDDAGILPGQLDCVIVATVSHMMQTPAVATAVAHELGSNAAAFDISAACAGFCHGIALASDLVRGGSATHVLVVGVERLSDITDPKDRGTAFIFADGAGAAIVGPSDEPGIGPVVWGSDGNMADKIYIADRNSFIHQEGQAVFRWATTALHPVARAACERAGVDPTSLAAFVPHQANLRIVEAIARKIGAPQAKVADDIVYSGNTSSASIPIALSVMIERGELGSGDAALLLGFGAGISYGAQVITVP
jgi:3-oxoacyl-[acyl-carrier-protein] synthase-3